MHAAASRATAAYQTTQVQSRTPLEQVVLLYDAAIGGLTRARAAIDAHDLRERHRGISQALAVLNHLQSTLNLEGGGELANTLDALYSYVRERMLDANVNQRAEPIDEALRLLGTLREGWAEIAANPPRLHAVDRSEP
ncbi:MAG TPA: flagellar export chaperone FliS [Vicinamibacterales bacterium]|jgi:flagellar protein FliS